MDEATDRAGPSANDGVFAHDVPRGEVRCLRLAAWRSG